jgi:hypothetical protein
LKPYLEAQDAFIEWLDGDANCDPTAAEVERALFGLAKCAADRGMSDVHWMFVMDGLVAHAKRRCPDNIVLPGYVARSVDFSVIGPSVKAAAAASPPDV